jgi:hypothetical protein
MIYNSLSNLLSQGNPKDFEIKIDGLTVVHRTNRLNKFSLYRKSMFEFTNEVTFMIYIGKSRVNDKYILSRNLLANKSPIDIKAEVNRIVKEKQHEYEFQRLKEVEVYQKKKIQKLKLKIEDLEGQKTGDLKEVLGAIGKLIPSNTNTKGVIDPEIQQILDLIKHYKSNHSEKDFKEALAVGITLAESPDLIKDVKQFINKKKEERENEKEQKQK